MTAVSSVSVEPIKLNANQESPRRKGLKPPRLLNIPKPEATLNTSGAGASTLSRKKIKKTISEPNLPVPNKS